MLTGSSTSLGLAFSLRLSVLGKEGSVPLLFIPTLTAFVLVLVLVLGLPLPGVPSSLPASDPVPVPLSVLSKTTPSGLFNALILLLTLCLVPPSYSG